MKKGAERGAYKIRREGWRREGRREGLNSGRVVKSEYNYRGSISTPSFRAFEVYTHISLITYKMHYWEGEL